MAHVLNTNIASSSLFARLRGVAENARTSWALYKEYKRTYDELDALTDRLAGLGFEVDLTERHTFEGHERAHVRDAHGNRVELLAPA